MRTWVNGKFLSEEINRKALGWKPPVEPGKVLWGMCPCGARIYEGDTVWMQGDHKIVVCFDCRHRFADGDDNHLDCAGMRLPGLGLGE